jgi:hypothetical protein
MATQINQDQTLELATAPGRRLCADAAASWDGLARECQARHGWTPTIVPGGAYRSTADQGTVFQQYYAKGNLAGKAGYTNDVRWWNGQPWTRRAGMPAAAVPGTSNHGSGIAVDAGRAGASFSTFAGAYRMQLMALAGPRGWSDTEGRVASEPWHLVFTKAAAAPGGSVLASLPVLRKGSTGAVVKTAQVLVTAAGFDAGEADGIAGNKWVAAVAAFQKARGLVDDAVVGVQTWPALLGV